MRGADLAARARAPAPGAVPPALRVAVPLVGRVDKAMAAVQAAPRQGWVAARVVGVAAAVGAAWGVP